MLIVQTILESSVNPSIKNHWLWTRAVQAWFDHCHWFWIINLSKRPTIFQERTDFGHKSINLR